MNEREKHNSDQNSRMLDDIIIERESQKEYFKVIPIVYMILRKDDSILLLKKKNTGRYSLPGGHLEEKERLDNAAIRETEEETGVTIGRENIRYLHLGHRNDAVFFFFQTDVWNGEPQIIEPEIHDELLWTSVNNLPENVRPFIKEAFSNILNGIPYTEYE